MFFLAVSCAGAYNKSLPPQHTFLGAAENVTIQASSILTQKGFVMESPDVGSSIISLMAAHLISVSTVSLLMATPRTQNPCHVLKVFYISERN
jgi:hypothetical protein